jgi:hypothetical protein
MALSYRQIGARNKLQGGGSVNNIFIGNKLATAQPIIISGNDVLIDSIKKKIRSDAGIVQNITLPVENLVKLQPVDFSFIAGLVAPFTKGLLLNQGSTFTSDLLTQYEFLFSSTVLSEFEKSIVLIDLAIKLSAFSEETIVTYAGYATLINNKVTEYFANYPLLLKTFGEFFVTILFDSGSFSNEISGRVPSTPNIVSGIIKFITGGFNKSSNIICKIIIPSQSETVIGSNFNQFVARDINESRVFSSFVITIQDKKLNVLNTAFTLSVTAPILSIPFSSTITNRSHLPVTVNVCTYVEMTPVTSIFEGFGLLDITNSPL